MEPPQDKNPGRKILQISEDFEVVSIDWNSKEISEMHNHGWSRCSVFIEAGIFENILDLGGKKEVSLLRAGDLLHMPIASRHEMKCIEGPGKSFHVYTPKLQEWTEQGIFSSDPGTIESSKMELGPATETIELRKQLLAIREASVKTHSPYFMNQLFSGLMPQASMASEIISQTKTTLATQEASPIFSEIESRVVDSLGELLGWPKTQREGVPVPGGSAANFMALHCARQRKFPDFRTKGYQGNPLKVLASKDSHYSLKKACVVLGLGTEGLILVGTDNDGRMNLQDLERKLGEMKSKSEIPIMVCATAGTTVYGAFDPLEAIAKICRNYGVWFHVDAAWGGPAIFSKKLKSLVNGIGLADSVSFDAHKLLGADLTCSFFLTRHVGILLEANDVSGGDYLFHSQDPKLDRGRLSWQCGRSAEAFGFWTIWKSFGTAGLGEFVDRLIKVKEDSLAWINSQERLRLIGEAPYLNLCLRILPPKGIPPDQHIDWSKKVRQGLIEKNLAMVNYFSDQDGSFLRIILSHPHIQSDHVIQILKWALEFE